MPANKMAVLQRFTLERVVIIRVVNGFWVRPMNG